LRLYLFYFIISLFFYNNTFAAIANKISISGNEKISKATILEKLEFTKGGEYSSSLLNKSLKNLYNTGLFKNITINHDKNHNIFIEIKEQPTVLHVSLIDFKNVVGQKDILKSIPLKEGAIFNDYKLQESINHIKEKYKERGYFNVIIKHEIKIIKNNTVHILFYADKNIEKTKIKDIQFINNTFSHNALMNVIASNTYSILNMFNSSDVFYDKKIEYDKYLLSRFYFTHGYLDFSIENVVTEINDNNEALLSFILNEGKQYFFDSLKIENNLEDNELSDNDINGINLFKKGEEFNIIKASKIAEILKMKLNLLGYPFVNIKSSYIFNNNKATLKLIIEKSQRIFIRHINIKGNDKTRDYVIRRNLKIYESGLLTADGIESSQRALEALGFFSKVNINYRQIEGFDDLVDIDIEIEEGKTGDFSYNLSFSTAKNIAGAINIVQHNFRGTGETIGITIDTSGSKDIMVKLKYENPHIFDTEIDYNFEIFNGFDDTGAFVPYKQNSRGIVNSISLPIANYLSNITKYSILHSEIESDSLKNLYSSAKDSNIISEISSGIVYNKSYRDDYSVLVGSKGNYFISIAGLGLDGDDIEKYIKATASFEYKRPILENIFGRPVYFKASANLEAISSYGNYTLDIRDRFFLGGMQVRGFDFIGIGPRENSKNSNPLGGQVGYYGSFELNYPVFDSLSYETSNAVKGVDLNLVLFMDFGNVTGISDSKLNVKYNDSLLLRKSIGFGLAFNTPIAPMFISIGYPISKEDYDVTNKFNLQMRKEF